VGLTAEDLGDFGRLAALAVGSSKSNRSEIYLAVARLFLVQGAQLSERERALMRDILKRLAFDVEMAIRVSLAERLADDPDAPLELVLLLADDAIEVARPVILRSRKLSDRDILTFIATADESRQTICAERPHIGEPVTDRLAQSDAEPVLAALVRNATAKIAPSTFETLIEKSRKLALLQEPLARRDDLPEPLATRLCLWASDALKTYIIQSRGLDPARIAEAIDRATQSVIAPPKEAALDSGAKLIEKLAIAGQLKPGFLLRVLQQQQMDLFDRAFAKLLEIELPVFRDMFYRHGARPVALACRAVGIDRCVFPTVYSLSRQSRRVNAILSPEDRHEVEAVFATFARKEALGILKQVTHA
jgi:uncharacterized protein (DUF2336 family)